MITLSHKASGAKQVFNLAYFNKNKVDFSLYDIIEWDVVELVWGNEGQVSEGWFDPELAKKKISKSSPAMNYRLKDVPRPDLTPSFRPINTPVKNIAQQKIAKIKPVISKAFKNDYIKYTIIGVFVTIISYFLYEYFKYKKW